MFREIRLFLSLACLLVMGACAAEPKIIRVPQGAPSVAPPYTKQEVDLARTCWLLAQLVFEADRSKVSGQSFDEFWEAVQGAFKKQTRSVPHSVAKSVFEGEEDWRELAVSINRRCVEEALELEPPRAERATFCGGMLLTEYATHELRPTNNEAKLQALLKPLPGYSPWLVKEMYFEMGSKTWLEDRAMPRWDQCMREESPGPNSTAPSPPGVTSP